MLTPEQIATLFMHWRARHQDRDDRIYLMNKVLEGDLGAIDPDEEELPMRSPNFVQVALEDTAESASLVPTVRCRPTKAGPKAKEAAAKMESIGSWILQSNGVELLIPKTVMDLARTGGAVFTVTPDFEEQRVRIELRDIDQCYPEPGWQPGDKTRRVMFGRSVYWSQLPAKYQALLSHALAGRDATVPEHNANIRVGLIDYYDENEIVTVAAVEGAKLHYAGDGTPKPEWIPVQLRRVEHNLGVCPAIVEGRITFDDEMRGQFDQVVQMLLDHVRLFSLAVDYADQAVYSDVYVKDLIGQMPYGGGAYIELGPNGDIGRVPPAVSSLDLTRDLERLVDGIHLGARWPKSRPGEIDQSIASAKFLETSAGLMNTAIRTYHLILQRMMSKALRVAFVMDKHYFSGVDRVATGVLRNQEFALEFDSASIDLSAEVGVEYGLGLGRDPSQSAVLHIQYAKENFISPEFVQENIDGLRDVAREQARIDIKDFKAMALAKLLQGLEAGQIPDSALIEIARARADGDDIFDIYEKYVVEPAQQAQDQMIPTGLGGPMMPGPMALPPAGPGGPPGAAGPGGPPAPPPAPGGADLLARLNSPAGPGGTLGTQVTTGRP